MLGQVRWQMKGGGCKRKRAICTETISPDAASGKRSLRHDRCFLAKSRQCPLLEEELASIHRKIQSMSASFLPIIIRPACRIVLLPRSRSRHSVSLQSELRLRVISKPTTLRNALSGREPFAFHGSNAAPIRGTPLTRVQGAGERKREFRRVPGFSGGSDCRFPARRESGRCSLPSESRKAVHVTNPFR